MRRLLSAVVGTLILTPAAFAFQIYAFVPYGVEGIKAGGGPLRASTEFFLEHNIKPIQVIYEPALFDVTGAQKKDSLANPTKIESAAKELQLDKEAMVSLDVESWNRFDKSTPEKYLDLLTRFHKANPQAKIGLYATLPQNIFKWDPTRVEKYNQLNERYAFLVKHVDYLSPSFYNYTGRDYQQWLPSVKYSMGVAKRISAGKPIFPYITPQLKSKDGDFDWLTYEEMLERLHFIKDAGADGVIVWTSSGAREQDGRQPKINVETGWVKALIDFQKKYGNSEKR